MIATRIVRPQPRPRQRDHQKQQAQQLKQQAPRLLDPLPVLHLRPRIGRRPEPQRRHHLPPLRTVQQIQRDHPRRDRSGHAEQFAEAEIQKVHYSIAPLRTIGPKSASSIGTLVGIPT